MPSTLPADLAGTDDDDRLWTPGGTAPHHLGQEVGPGGGLVAGAIWGHKTRYRTAGWFRTQWEEERTEGHRKRRGRKDTKEVYIIQVGKPLPPTFCTPPGGVRCTFGT